MLCSSLPKILGFQSLCNCEDTGNTIDDKTVKTPYRKVSEVSSGHCITTYFNLPIKICFCKSIHHFFYNFLFPLCILHVCVYILHSKSASFLCETVVQNLQFDLLELDSYVNTPFLVAITLWQNTMEYHILYKYSCSFWEWEHF